LWILDQNSVDYQYKRIIQELTSRSRTRIKTSDGLSEEVQINTGIRQGDSFSSTLFNIIMDQTIENIKKVNARYKIANRTIRRRTKVVDIMKRIIGDQGRPSVA